MHVEGRAPYTMKAYYLDQPVTDGEIAEARELTGFDVSQVRIPYVLPTAMPDEAGNPRMPPGSDEASLAALRAAGILADSGRRVFLVATMDLHWNSRFADGVFRLTGHFPYLIQTAGQRNAIDNPGLLRVLDMEGMMG